MDIQKNTQSQYALNPNIEKKLKVAIYCRLSEEDRDKECKENDSKSIQNQKLMLTNYAIMKDWEIQGIYSDDDYTGADRKRPDFNKILKLAENREMMLNFALVDMQQVK